MKKYIINKESFNTKANIRLRVKEIIQSGDLTKSNLKFINALLSYHSNKCWIQNITKLAIEDVSFDDSVIYPAYDQIDSRAIYAYEGLSKTIVCFSALIAAIPSPTPSELKIMKVYAEMERLQAENAKLQVELQASRNKFKLILDIMNLLQIP